MVASVIGRDAELRAADAFLDRLADGPSALVLEGEAGIGKSTVWAEIVRRVGSDGAMVLTARAASLETGLTLATLADLLEPVSADAYAALPEPQRRALDAALVRIEPTRDALEMRLLGTSVRSLLEHLASERPVVLAIDDLQWTDTASARALSYALRRTVGAPVAVVAASRAGEALPFDPRNHVGPDRSTTIRVGPLTIAALHQVLKERLGGPVARSTLVRVRAASGGNPFFAIEIMRLLDEIGVPPAGAPLPVPADVRDLVRRRVARLPAATRHVLLAASVLPQARIEILRSAIGGAVERAIDAAVADGFVHVTDSTVEFEHPLFAAAIQANADAQARRDVHRRLAGVVVEGEERARHRALAADGPDEAAALDLQAAARATLARAAPAAAAGLIELAIDLTPPDRRDEREDRRIELADYLKRAGEPARAERILEAVIAGASDARRARASLDLAAIRFETDASSVAVELCERAIADAEGEPELQARAHATWVAVSWEDFRAAAAHIEAAQALLAKVADPDPLVLGLVLMERCSADLNAGRPLDPAIVEQGLALERRASPASVSERFSASLGTWLKRVDDLAGARIWLDRTVQAAIDEGDEGSLAYAVSHVPELEVWAGNWSRAEEYARRHHEVAVELGLEAQRRQALYNLGLVLVHQGRGDEARAIIDEALQAAESDDDLWTTTTITPLLGLLELSLGNAAAAAEQLLRATELRDRVGQDTPRRHDGDLVESLVAIGDLAGATAAIEQMERRAAKFGVHWALANAARSRAIVAAASGDLDGAAAALATALDEHDRGLIPFDRARTLLVLGQVRRRRRERGAARDAFTEAHQAFASLGARLWAMRAAGELDRVGLRRAPRHDLTEGERRVAELAASGRTNREIAAALFVSPRTVESNLARAYQKLGVSSRAELGALMGGAAASPEPQT